MQHISLPTKFVYWVGQLAEGLKNTAFGVFLLFYYNQVLGVSGTLCGAALFIGMVFDAVTDPLMGSISDGWRSKYGRRHPFMYASAVPLGLCFFLLFNPMVEGETGLFIWLLVFVVLTRFSMTLYHVPHVALGAEMTSDYHERNTLAAGRMVFNSVGALTVYGLGFGVFFAASEAFPNGQLNGDAYPPYAAILGVGMCVAILVTSIGTRHLVPHLPVPRASQQLKLAALFKDMWAASNNRSFIWLITGFVVVSVPVGVGTSLQLYLNTFFWEVPPEAISIILGSGVVATFFGFAASPWIMRRIEKKQALFVGSIGWALFYASPVVLHYAGLFPAPGSEAVVIALAISHFLAGAVVSQLIVAVISMLADVADEQELATDKRQEGVFFGAYSFVIKATGGLGAATSGIVLDIIEWPTGESVQSAADVPTETLFQLAMVAGPALAIGFIPAVLLWRNYKLTKHRHEEILTELQAGARA